MSFVQDFINFVLHVDKTLGWLIQTFGLWTYAILFLIIFLETGLVVTPFFPGDSLIFIAGTFAANGLLNVAWLFVIFCAAAIIGDTANYWIGHFAGEKLFQKNSKFFKKEYLETASEFYDKHGGKTIILARFIPIIRTFAPFVAGIGKMSYFRFIMYNVVGGIAWVALFLFGGYYFGGLAAVQANLTAAIYAIIIISFLPIVGEFLWRKRKKIKSGKK